MMEESLISIIDNKKLYYGTSVRGLIELITRVQGKVDLDAQNIFGKHIHAFTWAFFTGLNHNKKEKNPSWEYKDTFSLGTIKRDGADVVADVMVMVALNEFKISNIEEDFTKNSSIREILNIISCYAEGGAKYILEIREGNDLNSKTYLNNIDDFYEEIINRLE